MKKGVSPVVLMRCQTFCRSRGAQSLDALVIIAA
ncbi:hypothetical protein M2244_001787 [Rhodoferax antarcticus]|nr:hypothetical protein [Rhodoferax antarcticus]